MLYVSSLCVCFVGVCFVCVCLFYVLTLCGSLLCLRLFYVSPLCVLVSNVCHIRHVAYMRVAVTAAKAERLGVAGQCAAIAVYYC